MLLSTNRISIRKINIDDAKFILSLMNTATWKEFIGDRNLKTETDVVDHLQIWAFNNYDKHGFGPYLVTDNNIGKPVGICGLFKRETLDRPDLGFALLPEYMGKGYAHEASKIIINFACDNLQLDRLYAVTNNNNKLSIKLLTKLGFKQIPLNYDPNATVFEMAL